MSRPTITAVIPTLNEEGNLPHVLPRIPRAVDEVILVDGHSTDRTVEVARELLPDIKVVMQEGKGKGAALRTAFAAATGDIIVMLDADGSTAPEEIPAFVHALMAGADFAKGSRFLHGGGTSDMPFHRRMGNKSFVRMVRWLYGGQYTDLCYGYNAFWRRVLPYLDLDGDGFEIETMMNIRALRSGLRIVEVPSFEDRRVIGVGRLRTVPDGWRVLRTIWSERRRTALPLVASDGPAVEWQPAMVVAESPVAVDEAPVKVSTNGNGHANGNGNGHGHHADIYHSAAFSDVQAVAEAGAGYAAIEVGAQALEEPAVPWAEIADTYLGRLTNLIDSVDRQAIARVVDELRAARDRGSTIFFAGNGGSSATAARWVTDLGKATKGSGRPPMRVMNLTDNVPWLTALGNDEGIERVFSGQLENFARPNDVVVVISASGNSPNILDLLTTARSMGLRTIGLIGFDGGRAQGLLDEVLRVDTETGAYGLVGTAHTALTHIVTSCLISDRARVAIPAD